MSASCKQSCVAGVGRSGGQSGGGVWGQVSSQDLSFPPPIPVSEPPNTARFLSSIKFSLPEAYLLGVLPSERDPKPGNLEHPEPLISRKLARKHVLLPPGMDSKGPSLRAASPCASGAFRIILQPLCARLPFAPQDGAAGSGGRVRVGLQGSGPVRLRGADVPFQQQPSALEPEVRHRAVRGPPRIHGARATHRERRSHPRF